jgi:hypothetical protein
MDQLINVQHLERFRATSTLGTNESHEVPIPLEDWWKPYQGKTKSAAVDKGVQD